MDLATLIGLLLAWGALATAFSLEGGGLKELFNLPAFILVVFGTIGAALITSNIRTVLSLPGILANVFLTRHINATEAIDTIVNFARIARKQGILALDEASEQVDNKFLRKGVELVVDGTASVVVREILETEIATMQERHKAGEQFFSSLGGYSPTLGIIGTVMGLISMLAKLSEPGKMGHAIAGAFIATLYGVALANLFYLPVGSKLKAKSIDEVITYEMIIEGILAIQAGDNPRTVEMKMLSFLPPALRIERELAINRDSDDSRAA